MVYQVYGGQRGVLFNTGFENLIRDFKGSGETQRRLRKAMFEATREAAEIVKDAVIREIDLGQFERDAALTIALKGFDHPLIERGRMRDAITAHRQGDGFVVGLRVGVRGAGGRSFLGIYKLLQAEPDFRIRVTDPMRVMFKALWLVSIGKKPVSELWGRAAVLYQKSPGTKWKPLDPSTTEIVIPGRPFLKQALNDPALREKIREVFERHLRIALDQEARHQAARATPRARRTR